MMTIRVLLHTYNTYQHISILIDVLVGVDELTATHYANEQCSVSQTEWRAVQPVLFPQQWV